MVTEAGLCPEPGGQEVSPASPITRAVSDDGQCSG